MLLKASEEIAESLDISSENLQDMIEIARWSEMPEIMRSIRIFSALLEEIRYSSNRRILTEMAIIRAARPLMGTGGGPNDADASNPERRIEQFQERIRVLERQVLSGQEKMAELESRPATGPYRPEKTAGNENGFSRGSGEEIPEGNHSLSNNAQEGYSRGRNAREEDYPAGVGKETDTGPEAAATEVNNTSAAGRGHSGPAAGMSGTDVKMLREAVPEEIRKVIAHWEELISQAPDGLLKVALHKAAGESLGEDGQLVIVFSSRMTKDIFTEHAENRKWLEDLLAEKSGCRIRVEYKALDKGEKFTDNYVNLKDLVQMPVEETLP